MDSFLIAWCSALSVLAGGWLVCSRFEWAKRNSARITAFAAGVLVSLALVEIVPESVKNNGEAGLWIALGFLVMYLFEHSFSHPHCAEDELPHKGVSLLMYFAMLFHSLVDGVTLATGFEVSKGLGSVVGMGVLVHKLPEGLAVGALLLHRGFSRMKIFIMVGVLGIAVPVSTYLSVYVLSLQHQNSSLPFIVLAAIAGMFIYIGVADLLTHSHEKKDRTTVSLFLLGFSTFILRHLFAH